MLEVWEKEKFDLDHNKGSYEDIPTEMSDLRTNLCTRPGSYSTLELSHWPGPKGSHTVSTVLRYLFLPTVTGTIQVPDSSVALPGTTVYCGTHWYWMVLLLLEVVLDVLVLPVTGLPAVCFLPFLYHLSTDDFPIQLDE
jgi:hypothetical protein